MKVLFDIQDVIDAGCNLAPIVCRYCGSYEVTFLQYVGDAQCGNCGEWQLEPEQEDT